MNRAIYDRFREIIPVKKIEDVDIEEAFSSCQSAFEIINYKPNHLEKSFQDVWRSSNAQTLFKFVWDVYVEDSHEANRM